MKKLTDLFDYIKNKFYIKKFESDQRNYKNGCLLVTSKYCNAITDIIIYENS